MRNAFASYQTLLLRRVFPRDEHKRPRHLQQSQGMCEKKKREGGWGWGGNVSSPVVRYQHEQKQRQARSDMHCCTTLRSVYRSA